MGLDHENIKSKMNVLNISNEISLEKELKNRTQLLLMKMELSPYSLEKEIQRKEKN